MLLCYNRGCGSTFDPSNNPEGCCCHHPGKPFFHDVYKGWTCCKKKTVDFTDFLNIKGCVQSKHSNEKPIEDSPEKELLEQKEQMRKMDIMRAPISAPKERPPVDAPLTKISIKATDAVKATIDAHKANSTTSEETQKSTKKEVTVGTACKNAGCTYVFQGTSDVNINVNECQYHSGVPIFHEGLKYWSCCQKKTTDFAVFMAQKGCTGGQHMWFKEETDKKVVNCRYDWHQTSQTVIVAIYAKMCHYDRSTVEVNPIRLHVNLVFVEPHDAKFDLDLELRGIIDVAKTTVQMLGSKLEITMYKAELGSWSKLDFPRDKLPVALKADANLSTKAAEKSRSSDSEDDFNLDDIETVNTGVRLAEISSKYNDVD